MARTDDNMTRDGAKDLAQRVVAYWLQRGKRPVVRLVPVPGGRDQVLYCVRSDMVDGVPHAG